MEDEGADYEDDEGWTVIEMDERPQIGQKWSSWTAPIGGHAGSEEELEQKLPKNDQKPALAMFKEQILPWIPHRLRHHHRPHSDKKGATISTSTAAVPALTPAETTTSSSSMATAKGMTSSSSSAPAERMASSSSSTPAENTTSWSSSTLATTSATTMAPSAAEEEEQIRLLESMLIFGGGIVTPTGGENGGGNGTAGKMNGWDDIKLAEKCLFHK